MDLAKWQDKVMLLNTNNKQSDYETNEVITLIIASTRIKYLRKKLTQKGKDL